MTRMVGNRRGPWEEYLSQAATLRSLAGKTRYPDVRERLLLLAASFERLAYEVEKWQD